MMFFPKILVEIGDLLAEKSLRGDFLYFTPFFGPFAWIVLVLSEILWNLGGYVSWEQDFVCFFSSNQPTLLQTVLRAIKCSLTFAVIWYELARGATFKHFASVLGVGLETCTSWGISRQMGASFPIFCWYLELPSVFFVLFSFLEFFWRFLQLFWLWMMILIALGTIG